VKHWCHDLAQLEAVVFQVLRKRDYEKWVEAKPRRGSKNAWMLQYYSDRRWAYDLFFEECKKKQNDYMKLFEDKRSPIFVATSNSSYAAHRADSKQRLITYNARLTDYDFIRVFDPAHAYQEIWMFMNNMALPMKPIPVFDDVTMAESKGFNKFSFRKDPIKKKKK
jgi:hypothetical protein